MRQQSMMPSTPTTTSGGDSSNDENDSCDQDCRNWRFLTVLAKKSPLFQFPTDNIVQKLGKLTLLPKCIVFDLDDTLWIGDVDCTAGPPFTPYCSAQSARGKKDVRKQVVPVQPQHHGCDGLYDASSYKRYPALQLFPDVFAILSWIDAMQPDLKMAIASRTTTPHWASKALQTLRVASGSTVWSFTSCCECGDVNKQKHLRAIARKLNIDIGDIVFYDNLHYNIEDVEALTAERDERHGRLTAMFTPRGLNWSNFVDGLLRFQASRST